MVPRGWNRGGIRGPAHPTISPDAGVPQELTPPHDEGLRKDFRCAGLLSRAKLGRHRPGKRLGLSSLSLRDGSSGSQNCKLPKNDHSLLAAVSLLHCPHPADTLHTSFLLRSAPSKGSQPWKAPASCTHPGATGWPLTIWQQPGRQGHFSACREACAP